MVRSSISKPTVPKLPTQAARTGSSSGSQVLQTLNYSSPAPPLRAADALQRKERRIHVDDALWDRLERTYKKLRTKSGDVAPSKTELLEQVIGAGLESVERRLAKSQHPKEQMAEAVDKPQPRPASVHGAERGEPAAGAGSDAPSQSPVALTLRVSASVNERLQAASARLHQTVEEIATRAIVRELERLQTTADPRLRRR